RSFIIGNVGRKGLDIYPPLFMNGNFMQEGRQHEYDWCPLLTSGVKALMSSIKDKGILEPVLVISFLNQG
ncbi:MAG: hypothetical protein NT010_12095, partial [Proteobacteria bacterium]|nr:hypothetical protein [Pseudomonadota bacterium]